MNILTQADRDTLNAAMDILQSKMTESEYWTMTLARHKDHKPYFDMATCTPLTNTFQHWLAGETFADKIETGRQFIADEAANYPTPEQQKAAKIERLKRELSELEGDAA